MKPAFHKAFRRQVASSVSHSCLLTLQDISGVFGMHSSSADFGQEVFDVEDEEAAAVWDLDELEVERLRAAASQQQQSSGVSGLLGLTPGAVEGPAGEGRAVLPLCSMHATTTATDAIRN